MLDNNGQFRDMPEVWPYFNSYTRSCRTRYNFKEYQEIICDDCLTSLESLLSLDPEIDERRVREAP